MQAYANLDVWKRSHRLVLLIYAATRRFPKEELFGLTSQLRRAAVSIPANIVEGSKRVNRTDFARFLNIAEGSVAEVEYFLQLTTTLGFLSQDEAAPLLESATAVAQMLFRLRSKVQRTEATERAEAREQKGST